MKKGVTLFRSVSSETTLLSGNEDNCLQNLSLRLLAETGLEPESFHAVNTSTKQQSPNLYGKKSTKVLDIPQDLAYLMQKWENLPNDIKKSILPLVKHCARKGK